MNNVRVMIVAPVPPPEGGDSTWTVKYLSYCKQHDIDHYHVNTALIGHRRDTTDEKRQVLYELKRTMGILKGIKEGCKSFKPDIVHFNSNCSPFGLIRDAFGARKIYRYGIPYIIHCRCTVQDQLGSNRIAKRLFRIMTKGASRVFVQNEATKKFVDERFGLCSDIMPNCIENESITEKKHIEAVISNAVFVGHLRKTKGVRELIAVAKTIPTITFKLIGPIAEPEVAEEAEGISNIQIVGEVPHAEIISYLDQSDVFVFPTYTEGFSNSLLEAMSRGLPVITTPVGANTTMIEDKGGIIVKIGNTDDLESALYAVASQDVREKMSVFNIEKVKTEYSVDGVMRRIFCIYREVMSDCENNYKSSIQNI